MVGWVMVSCANGGRGYGECCYVKAGTRTLVLSRLRDVPLLYGLKAEHWIQRGDERRRRGGARGYKADLKSQQPAKTLRKQVAYPL